MRNESLARYLVKIRESNAGHFRVRGEVKVGAIREAAELFAPERKIEFKIYCTLGIGGSPPPRPFKLMDGVLRDTYHPNKRKHCFSPRLEAFLPLVRAHEIFDFHLLEFARTKDEVARRYLVPERFPYLRDAERQFRMETVDYIFEVHENPASGFRTKIRNRGLIFCCANMRLEHHVELPDVAERPAAFRTFLLNLIRAEPAFAFFALDEGVGESAHMAARLPRFRIHENGRIHAVHIITLIDEHSPPEILYIFFERDAQRSVVPRAREPAVYLRAGINKAPTFC